MLDPTPDVPDAVKMDGKTNFTFQDELNLGAKIVRDQPLTGDDKDLMDLLTTDWVLQSTDSVPYLAGGFGDWR